MGSRPGWSMAGCCRTSRSRSSTAQPTRSRGGRPSGSSCRLGKAAGATVTGVHGRMHIESRHAVARTIFIDTDAVRPSQFDLSDAERKQLYTKGRQAATDFLDGTDDQDAWDFDRYRERFRTGPSAR